MTDKKSSDKRRKLLKSIAAGSGAIVAGKSLPENWARPVVGSVLLPAHAQTSGATAYIRVVSPATENLDFPRLINITDDTDTVLAFCCCGETSDIIIEVTSLAAGTYHVFADSDGPLNHTVLITTEAGTTSVTAPTDAGGCNYHMATVTLPAGTVVPAGGEIVGANKCGPNLNCLGGGAPVVAPGASAKYRSKS